MLSCTFVATLALAIALPIASVVVVVVALWGVWYYRQAAHVKCIF